MPNQTKEMIVVSFCNLLLEKSFEKISVKDIVETCGINRKTFYYYFKDIYDLVEYALRTELERYIDAVPENNTLEDSVSGILELVEKNKKAVRHINMSSDSEIKRYLHEAIYDTIFKKYKSNATDFGVAERDFRLLCEIMVMSFLGLISNWFEGGMKPEYKEDIRRFGIMFGTSVGPMMKKIKETP